MKFQNLFVPTLGILILVGSVFCESHKDSVVTRQAPVFSSGNQYVDGNDPSGHGGQQVMVYDTLSNNKRPSSLASETYTSSQQQGKSNYGSTSYASSDASSSSGYSNSYSSPASPSPSYTPLGNRPSGYLETRPTVVVQPQPKPEETYAYYYQHYPSTTNTQQQYGTPSQSYGTGSNFGNFGGNLGGIFDSDIFSGLSGGGGGDLGGTGGALGGIGGLGALGLAGLAALAKGALAIKPLLIFGLLLIILLPLLILFLPIPIITIPTTPTGKTTTTTARQLASAVTSLTEKVLGSEECLERILCKIPPVPKKFQGHAKGLWLEYGPKVINNVRLTRGLDAYFNSTDVEFKHRAFKCNQQFKCSNKFF